MNSIQSFNVPYPTPRPLMLLATSRGGMICTRAVLAPTLPSHTQACCPDWFWHPGHLSARGHPSRNLNHYGSQLSHQSIIHIKMTPCCPQDLERLLRAPEPEPVQSPPPKQEQQQQPQQAEQAQAPPTPQPQDDVQVGESIQAKKRDPLQMIKRTAPLLSAAKSESSPRPLGPLTTAAGADETCVWSRVGITPLPML